MVWDRWRRRLPTDVVHAGAPDDEDLSLRETLAAEKIQLAGEALWSEALRGDIVDPCAAWAVLRGTMSNASVRGLSLFRMVDGLREGQRRLGAASSAPTAARPDDVGDGVLNCLEQVGVAFASFYAGALTVATIGIVASGGTFAVMFSAFVSALWTLGIVIGAVAASYLFVCILGALGVNIG